MSQNFLESANRYIIDQETRRLRDGRELERKWQTRQDEIQSALTRFNVRGIFEELRDQVWKKGEVEECNGLTEFSGPFKSREGLIGYQLCYRFPKWFWTGKEIFYTSYVERPFFAAGGDDDFTATPRYENVVRSYREGPYKDEATTSIKTVVKEIDQYTSLAENPGKYALEVTDDSRYNFNKGHKHVETVSIDITDPDAIAQYRQVLDRFTAERILAKFLPDELGRFAEGLAGKDKYYLFHED